MTATHQHATFEAWQADRERYADAATALLHRMIGYIGEMDLDQIDPESAARFLQHYLPEMREWFATYPEWSR